MKGHGVSLKGPSLAKDSEEEEAENGRDQAQLTLAAFMSLVSVVAKEQSRVNEGPHNHFKRPFLGRGQRGGRSRKWTRHAGKRIT